MIDLDALIAERDELAARLAEAERHGFGKPMPSRERIAEMHSRLPAGWFENALARNHYGGHPHYMQSDAEACYVCTLLGSLEAAEAG